MIANKQLQLVVIVGLIVALALSVILLAGRKPGVAIDQHIAVPGAMQSAAAYDDSAVVFSNSRSFVKYDYKSGVSTLLSPDALTADLAYVDSLQSSSDGNYLYFHTESTPSGSMLDVALKSRGLATDTDWWWLYSVVRKTYTPLPTGTVLAKADGNQINVLSINNSGEAITSYRMTDMAQTGRINIPKSTDFWAYGNGFLLQINDTIQYTTDGVVNQAYFTKAEMFGILPATDTAFAVVTNKDSRQIVSLDLKKQTEKVIARDIVGQPVSSAAGNVLYQTAGVADTVVYSDYQALTGKTSVWKLQGSKLEVINGQAATLAMALGTNTALINGTDGAMYLVGTGLHDIKTPNTGIISTRFADNTVAAQYVLSTDSFTLSYDGNYTLAAQAAIHSAIQQSGYNADLYPMELSIPEAP